MKNTKYKINIIFIYIFGGMAHKGKSANDP